jgi:hypothetical protein
MLCNMESQRFVETTQPSLKQILDETKLVLQGGREGGRDGGVRSKGGREGGKKRRVE